MGPNERRSAAQEDAKGGEQGRRVHAMKPFIAMLPGGDTVRMLKGMEEGSVCDSRTLKRFLT